MHACIRTFIHAYIRTCAAERTSPLPLLPVCVSIRILLTLRKKSDCFFAGSRKALCGFAHLGQSSFGVLFLFHKNTIPQSAKSRHPQSRDSRRLQRFAFATWKSVPGSRLFCNLESGSPRYEIKQILQLRIRFVQVRNLRNVHSPRDSGKH